MEEVPLKGLGESELEENMENIVFKVACLKLLDAE